MQQMYPPYLLLVALELGLVHGDLVEEGRRVRVGQGARYSAPHGRPPGGALVFQAVHVEDPGNRDGDDLNRIKSREIIRVFVVRPAVAAAAGSSSARGGNS